MSQSGSGKPDPVLEGVELLFHWKGGSASFGAKMVLSLNGVDSGCMHPITGSTCRAKCSHILHENSMTLLDSQVFEISLTINLKILFGQL